MTQKQIEEFKVIETLTDAGCTKAMIEDFLKKAKNDSETLRWLAGYRATILDEVHKCNRELECLDFLIYKIRKALHFI